MAAKIDLMPLVLAAAGLFAVWWIYKSPNGPNGINSATAANNVDLSNAGSLSNYLSNVNPNSAGFSTFTNRVGNLFNNLQNDLSTGGSLDNVISAANGIKANDAIAQQENQSFIDWANANPNAANPFQDASTIYTDQSQANASDQWIPNTNPNSSNYLSPADFIAQAHSGGY